MRIVFLGDISVSEPHAYAGDGLDFLRDADHVIANLEGPILPAREIELLQKSDKRVLYNAPEVIGLLKRYQVDFVSLANNHIFDHGDSLAFTRQTLAEAGIGSFGAGKDLAEAGEPALLGGREDPIRVYGFGWDVIGCQYAAADRPGVNPYQPQHLLGTIRALRKTDPDSRVIFYIHWNYELEDYPQPADRQLARKLIEEGVNAVIGLHPHIPQGAELHQGRPIVYSLGNWFFPPRNFGRLVLNFSSGPARQVAVELTIDQAGEGSAAFHWLEFDHRSRSLKYEKEEGWAGEHLARLTPFSGFSDQDYLRWFRKNKKKRYSLPVYRDYSLSLENWIKDSYVKARQRLIWLLVKLHLKR